MATLRKSLASSQIEPDDLHRLNEVLLDASVATYLMMRASPGFGAEAIRIRPNVAKSTFTIAW